MESNGIVNNKNNSRLRAYDKCHDNASEYNKRGSQEQSQEQIQSALHLVVSLVIRVISVEVPSLSISANPRDWICENSTCRTFVQNPTDAFAAKYCAVILQVRPITPSRIRSPQCDRIYPLSLFAIPVLMIAAITRGTRRSNVASSILNAGQECSLFYSREDI